MPSRRTPEPPRTMEIPVAEKTTAPKKLRVYEVAKDLGMSSEAVLQIVKRLGVEVKNHMSTLPGETVEKVREELGRERMAVKEEMARKHEQELQRARDERGTGHRRGGRRRGGAPCRRAAPAWSRVATALERPAPSPGAGAARDAAA